MARTIRIAKSNDNADSRLRDLDRAREGDSDLRIGRSIERAVFSRTIARTVVIPVLRLYELRRCVPYDAYSARVGFEVVDRFIG